MSELIIGIDLGTTNSMAAYVSETGAEIIEDSYFTTQTPSVVSQTENGLLVGAEALNQRTNYPRTTFTSFKRFMGRGAKDISENLTLSPFKVIIGERDKILIGEEGAQLSPEQISAEVLREIKRKAEIILGKAVKKTVITVPAYFDDAQRQATKDAAQIAGLEVTRIINEPTAAAIAYGLQENKKGKIAVYDFGGGTFDVSVLELKDRLFRVISTRGDTHLGGDDLDNLIIRRMIRDILPEVKDEKELSPETIQRLKRSSEILKIALSTNLETSLEIELPERGIKTKYSLSQKEFEEEIRPKVEETLAHVKEALHDAELTAGDIEEVVMVGGSSRIPLVRHLVEAFFGIKPHIRINPEQVVAIGAAIQGHLLSGGRKDYLLMDVIPLSLGIETIGGVFSKMVMKNASIPAKVTEVFSTSVDNQTGIELSIFQGEREFVRDCRKLGKFVLKGIPPMPAGLPKVEVTFFVDVNGLLTVSAKELRSEVESKIEIIPTHGLNRNEITRMIKDSMEYAVDDFNQRNLVEFRDKITTIIDGIDRIWHKADQFVTPDQIEAIAAHRKVMEDLRKNENPMLLKEAIDKMGDLTRDLADSIMGDAAKNILLEDSKKIPKT
ncbi:MAG: Fe-S protein assembly chaperone HscA [Deltaproteobacteria bacterium]|nr:Fe-S protein assembly chaperone HscA [Deltaproteobacteria bacterium]